MKGISKRQSPITTKDIKASFILRGICAGFFGACLFILAWNISPVGKLHKPCVVAAVIFMLFFAPGMFLDTEDPKQQKLYDYLAFADVNIILSALLYIMIAFAQRESIYGIFQWIRDYPRNFMEGLCIISLVNLALAALFNKNHRSYIFLTAVFTVLLSANYFKIQFRDTPLMPWDFFLMRVAATVAGRFTLIPSPVFIMGIGLFIASAIAVYIISKRVKSKPIGRVAKAVTLAAASGLLVFYMSTDILCTEVDLFKAKDYYMEKGFVAAFAECSRYIDPMREPEGYGKETMEKIYNKINKFSEEDKEVRPNIILLMSESFWDISRVKELGFEDEIFPTYERLKKTAVTGELVSNVYGGGTVNSEFEALTGFSVVYLPTEYMPYQRCMSPDFFSVNSYLESIGYDSLAIHPFEKTNYNRDSAYKYFGFDDTLWEEDFPEDADRMRGYISDHALTEKIISEFEKHKASSDAPWFNLSVSMQNHGGYHESSIDKNRKCNIDVSRFSENSQGAIIDLASGLHYADMALGELIDHFEKEEEPTLIIMFGDHMSDAGPSGETLIGQSALAHNESKEYDTLEQRKIPFMAWSNFKSIHKDCGILSITQLLPEVFYRYDLSMPKYFSYLKDSQKIYRACASGIVIGKDKTPVFRENMTAEERALYDEIELIEYDYIFGKRYLEDLFDY